MVPFCSCNVLHWHKNLNLNVQWALAPKISRTSHFQTNQPKPAVTVHPAILFIQPAKIRPSGCCAAAPAALSRACLVRVLIQAASLQAAIVTPGRENRRSGFAAWLRQLIGGKNQTSPMRCMTTRVDWGACSACACVLLANTPSVSSQALGFLSLRRCNNIRYKYPVSSSTMQQVNPSWQLHFAKSQMKWGWD